MFTSGDFDGGSPPKHIEKLVNIITEVAEKLNKEWQLKKYKTK